MCFYRERMEMDNLYSILCILVSIRNSDQDRASDLNVNTEFLFE